MTNHLLDSNQPASHNSVSHAHVLQFTCSFLFSPSLLPLCPAAIKLMIMHVVPCCGAMLWCHAVVPCCGAMLWCHAVVPCCGAMLWCHAVVPCCVVPCCVVPCCVVPCCVVPCCVVPCCVVPCCVVPCCVVPCCGAMLWCHAVVPCCGHVHSVHSCLKFKFNQHSIVILFWKLDGSTLCTSSLDRCRENLLKFVCSYQHMHCP